MSKLKTDFYSNAIKLLRQEVPENNPPTDKAIINTFLETYSWFKRGLATFDEIAHMCGFNKVALKIYYDRFEVSPALQEL
jgi:hypothetical protein